MSHFHNDTFTPPASGDYVAVCGAGGGSGFFGQSSPYRGGGGGGGAKASKRFTEVVGVSVSLRIPDNGVHNMLDDGADAIYAESRPLHCFAAAGKAPQFFGPVGKGGLATDCVGDITIAGVDGDGPVPDFTVGNGHTGGISADGTAGGGGGGVNGAAGGQDGLAPGGGGGGGGSMSAGNNQHSASSGGYIQVYKISDWATYPLGNPTAAPIAVYGTPPPPPPSSGSDDAALVI